MADITIETDWGAKGAQLTGAQVQAYLKSEIKALYAKCSELETKLSKLENSNEGGDGSDTEILTQQLQELAGRISALETKLDDSGKTSIQGQLQSLQTLALTLQQTTTDLKTQVSTIDKTVSESIPAIPPSGCEEISSVAAIPIGKTMFVANISANESFSLAETPAAGREIHVLVYNDGEEDVTVTLPTEGGYWSEEESLNIPVGQWGEINAVSDGTTIFLRSI